MARGKKKTMANSKPKQPEANEPDAGSTEPKQSGPQQSSPPREPPRPNTTTIDGAKSETDGGPPPKDASFKAPTEGTYVTYGHTVVCRRGPLRAGMLVRPGDFSASEEEDSKTRALLLKKGALAEAVGSDKQESAEEG